MKAVAALCSMAAMSLSMAACNGKDNVASTSAAAPDTHDADVKTLTDTEAQWIRDWQTKNPAKMASYYADDAVVMVPGGPPVSGRDAIEKELQEMVKDPAMSMTFQPARADVSKSGDLGYTQGAYALTMSDPKTHKAVTEHGSYVATYRKQADGSWKAVADIASSAGPAMPATGKKM